MGCLQGRRPAGCGTSQFRSGSRLKRCSLTQQRAQQPHKSECLGQCRSPLSNPAHGVGADRRGCWRCCPALLRDTQRGRDKSRCATAETCHHHLATSGAAEHGPSLHSCDPEAAFGPPAVTAPRLRSTRGHALLESCRLDGRDRSGEPRPAAQLPATGLFWRTKAWRPRPAVLAAPSPAGAPDSANRASSPVLWRRKAAMESAR
mgnify:CR=1 FL=1